MPPSNISNNAFTVSRDIRFSDSDPAGIVFYAEFFRMFNDLFEDWLTKCLGIDFAEQFTSKQRMFPLVHVDVDFKEPRRMGQKIDLSFLLTRLGRSSICYDIIGHDGDLEILRGSFVTCVASKKSMSTIELPADFRKLMNEYMARCGVFAQKAD
ncbi:MAG: 1,4-dihydroxy-2-naphthoyl-CoA hydrolase [Alphaproteobacteria bacterium MarineAlpha11_Bin1]|nr:MAG: 1,4-dihydroxy-2-naphthoyl-CoA hydrolase [Alphaproteobacteria bacterium MarineAlpha11_Bin1]|tara:strand:+ start:13881 stop:14342 length:462 start_codon:yes stop_codon:yes gene_type:complete